MKTKETWMWRDAKLWQFWLPQSGLAGGIVWGLVLAILFLLFGGDAHAQFAYECFRPDGSTFIRQDRCPEGTQWRRVQTDPYYTAPVTMVYERQAHRPDPNNVTYRWSPSLYGGGGGVVESPRQVQPQSNEELTRELNERYKNYGGYKQGQTLNKNAGNRGGYSWHK